MDIKKQNKREHKNRFYPSGRKSTGWAALYARQLTLLKLQRKELDCLFAGVSELTQRMEHEQGLLLVFFVALCVCAC